MESQRILQEAIAQGRVSPNRMVSRMVIVTGPGRSSALDLVKPASISTIDERGVVDRTVALAQMMAMATNCNLKVELGLDEKTGTFTLEVKQVPRDKAPVTPF